jgi:tripartite-type tricarboxylate transporter receptor subunit TctC
MRKVIALALALLAAGTLAAHAQAYPSRVVTIIVPYPAGGPTDKWTPVILESGVKAE